MSVRVGLVLVSHSERLAQGLAELAGQMAPDVPVVAAGGLEDGSLGTSYDRVADAVRGAQESLGEGGDVVVLGDLGSAVLTVESVLEVEEDLAQHAVIARGPFVESAVAAAVAAQGGRALDEVVRAVRDAGAQAGSGLEASGRPAHDPAVIERTVIVRNRLGLHARPAASLARLAAGLETALTIGPAGGSAADASSVLAILQLGATGGAQLVVRGAGPSAAVDVQAVVDAVESGFGED